MPASERQRVALRSRLAEVLGEEEAEVLMDSLPPMTWHDLATKDDLRATNDAIEANRVAIEANKMAIEASEERLRTEMNGKFALVEGEFAKVDAEFTKLRGDMALQFARQTRTMVFTMLGLSLPTWGAIMAVGIG